MGVSPLPLRQGAGRGQGQGLLMTFFCFFFCMNLGQKLPVQKQARRPHLPALLPLLAAAAGPRCPLCSCPGAFLSPVLLGAFSRVVLRLQGLSPDSPGQMSRRGLGPALLTSSQGLPLGRRPQSFPPAPTLGPTVESGAQDCAIGAENHQEAVLKVGSRTGSIGLTQDGAGNADSEPLGMGPGISFNKPWGGLSLRPSTLENGKKSTNTKREHAGCLRTRTAAQVWVCARQPRKHSPRLHGRGTSSPRLPRRPAGTGLGLFSSSTCPVRCPPASL